MGIFNDDFLNDSSLKNPEQDDSIALESSNDSFPAPRTGSIVFSARGLVKKYNGLMALSGTNITIEKGDIYGLVGANGSGKTTLLRVIAGLISIDEGQFELFGESNTSGNIAKERRRIGGVIESPHLYLGLTAKGNLIAQCLNKGLDTNRVDDLLRLVGLDSEIDSVKKVRFFSLGMAQRLGIALALLGNPEFIILDEPMNGLDPLGIIDIRNIILDLNSKGVTFLISSHILSELSKVATKYGFVRSGKIFKEVSADEIDTDNIEDYYLRITVRGGKENA